MGFFFTFLKFSQKVVGMVTLRDIATYNTHIQRRMGKKCLTFLFHQDLCHFKEFRKQDKYFLFYIVKMTILLRFNPYHANVENRVSS